MQSVCSAVLKSRVAVVLMLLPGAWASDASPLCLVSRSPASVSVIDPETWKSVANIPIESDPTEAFLCPRNRYLYVLHNGAFSSGLVGMRDSLPRKEGQLIIVDLQSRQVVRKLPVGWNVSGGLTPTGRFLLIGSMGRANKVEDLYLMPRGGPPEAGERSALTIVDTTNNAVTTVDVGPSGTRIAVTADLSRIFALTPPQTQRRRRTHLETYRFRVEKRAHELRTSPLRAKAMLKVLSPGQSKPLASIELEGWPEAIHVSSDGKLAYVLDRGVGSGNKGRRHDGLLQVVDTGLMKVVQSLKVGTEPQGIHALPDSEQVWVPALTSPEKGKGVIFRLQRAAPLSPVQTTVTFPRRPWSGMPAFFLDPPPGLRRVGGLRDWIVAAEADLCFLPPDSPTVTSCVGLRRAGTEATEFCEAIGEAVYLEGQDKLVFQCLHPSGRVGIVDRKGRRLAHEVGLGRGAVKFGRAVGLGLLRGAGLLSPVAGMISVAQRESEQRWRFRQQGLSLRTSADERFLYALNGATNDVTIADCQTGDRLSVIPVGSRSHGFQFLTADRFLWVHSESQITVVDTQTNRGQLEWRPPEGQVVKGLLLLEPQQRVVALTTTSLVVFDSQRASLLTTARGISDTAFLARPAPEP